MVFGSFTSMASYRLPRGKSLIKGRSHCPVCQHVLGVKDLVPLMSWLWGCGKCRYCHTAISPVYLLHECVLGAVFAVTFFVYGYAPLTLVLWGVSVCIIILIAVDLEHSYLPDPVQFSLALLGIAYGFFAYPSMLEPILGSVLYALLGLGLRALGYAIKKTEALGWGDVKFFGISGLFLGFDPAKAAVFFLCSGFVGLITAFIWKKSGKGRFFPFGPALATALMTVLLCLPV